MNSISRTLWALRNKISNRLWGVVRVPAQGKKGQRKGAVLLSYIVDSFILFPWQHKTDPHSNYWESSEIARLFAERGYDVDVIDARKHRFVPTKRYVACVDVQQDLYRLARYLPADCKKVIHIDNPHYEEYNKREIARLDALNKRRGASLTPKRQVADTTSAAMADFLEGLGSKSVLATYARLGKPVFPVPISVVEQFPFPEKKDFAAARKSFLYFGGGGAILKGLDLAVEAFAGMPDLTLHIVGPSVYEADFMKEYGKELALPNIIQHGRPTVDKNGHITLNGEDFKVLLDSCAAMIYPSAAEGTSGANIQAAHAGVIPIVTPETGLAEDFSAIIINDPSVESVRKATRDFSQLPEEVIRRKAKEIWTYARAHHTKETFSAAYASFIDNVLKL